MVAMFERQDKNEKRKLVDKLYKRKQQRMEKVREKRISTSVWQDVR